MNTTQAIQATSQTSDMVFKTYVSDLEDADLMRRPHGACNHVAWQLGHLISAECQLLNMLKPGAAPELPAGFTDAHNKDACGNDEPAAFLSKQEYLDLYDKVREATRAALETVSDADLDAPNPKDDMREMFPTVGSMFVLVATHPLMHAGQLVPLRRELGKPIVI